MSLERSQEDLSMLSQQSHQQPVENRSEFNFMYETLTPRQKEVLFPFLDGQTDQEIAAKLYSTQANIRFHLARIVRVFGLSDRKRDRCRNDLIDLFNQFKPDLVSDAAREKAGILSATPETVITHLVIPKQNAILSASSMAPDIPGRPMALNSAFYLQPNCAARCCEEVQVPGQLIRIRAPQMMGKTSLLYRMLHQAETNGYQALSLNFRYDLDEADLENFATFLQWFCRAIALRLNLPIERLPTTKLDCTEYLQNQILFNLATPLVIALDEVEVLFDHWAIAQEFFPLLRGWHESAKEPGLEFLWEKLRLIVVHSTEAYINFPSSPFDNIGYVAGLSPLQSQQVQILATNYGLSGFTATESDRLMHLVGGHPYLIQQALYCLARDGMLLDDLLANAPTLSGVYRHHLRELWNRLNALAQDNLVEALKQVIIAENNVRLNPEQTFKLEGMGLAISEGNRVRMSCELYRQFLQDWF